MTYGNGAWPRTNLDRVKTEISERWRATNSLASSVRRTKSFTTLMAMGTSGIGNDLRDAGVDMNHAQKLVEFIAQDDGQPNDYIRLRVAALQSNLTAKAATAGSSASSFASNCFHLGRNLGIQVVSDGIWVPLGKSYQHTKGKLCSHRCKDFLYYLGSLCGSTTPAATLCVFIMVFHLFSMWCVQTCLNHIRLSLWAPQTAVPCPSLQRAAVAKRLRVHQHSRSGMPPTVFPLTTNTCTKTRQRCAHQRNCKNSRSKQNSLTSRHWNRAALSRKQGC